MARIRFLQTSDIHLREDRPDRQRALALAFDAAREQHADALLICGDLFDRTADAPRLRALVREHIESLAPRPVVLLPGNHDHTCYGTGTDYGANAVVLASTPWARATVCGVEVVGIPYQHGRTAAECLTGVACDPRHTILLAHGSVMDGISGAFSGEGEDGAYMPIFLADMLRRGCYAALGHLHSGKNLIHREAERLVAYAGSPVTTSRREIGQRGVLIVDFEPSIGVLSHDFVPLPTAFHERVEVRCLPGMESEAVEQLGREAVALKRPGARILARLAGVSVLPETELREAAELALARAFGPTVKKLGSSDDAEALRDDPDASFPILELTTTSYSSLAQTSVVGEFVERLEACAKAEGIEDPVVLQTALRLGLDAFLESVP